MAKDKYVEDEEVFDVDFDEVDPVEEKEESKKEEPKKEKPAPKKEKPEVKEEKKTEEKEEQQMVEQRKQEIMESDEDLFGEMDESLANIPGIMASNIGTKISKYPVEKMKFVTSSKELISPVTENIIIAKTHYNDEIGQILCFDGACCDKLGLPTVRYVIPIVVYDTNKGGKPISQEIEHKALIIGQGTYEDLMTIHELNDMTAVDILVTCKDEKYQNISFNTAGESRWRKSKTLRKEVKEFWKKNKKHLITVIGKQMNEKRFLEEMGIDSSQPQAQGVSEVDFNDVFDEE